MSFMYIRVGNTVLKKRANHLVTYESVPKKFQEGYCLIRIKQGKSVKDIKFLPIKESILYPKPLVSQFKIRKLEDTRIKLLPRRKIQNLHEEKVKSNLFTVSSCRFYVFLLGNNFLLVSSNFQQVQRE